MAYCYQLMMMRVPPALYNMLHNDASKARLSMNTLFFRVAETRRFAVQVIVCVASIRVLQNGVVQEGKVVGIIDKGNSKRSTVFSLFSAEAAQIMHGAYSNMMATHVKAIVSQRCTKLVAISIVGRRAYRHYTIVKK